MKDLGALKTARKARGQRQIELAERSGIRQGNISKYEAGTMPLGFAAAKKLAKALDTDPALLIIHNQKAMMESAMKRNDPAGALLASRWGRTGDRCSPAGSPSG
jgi:transcriptional regulator with XRE-family HTH domain